MSQIYGNDFFLRNFFRNYFQCFFVFPVFTGVSEHKKRGDRSRPFPKLSRYQLSAQLYGSGQSQRLSYVEIVETIYVQSDLRVARCTVWVNQQIEATEVCQDSALCKVSENHASTNS